MSGKNTHPSLPASMLWKNSLDILRKSASDVANSVQSSVQQVVAEANLGGGIIGGGTSSSSSGTGTGRGESSEGMTTTHDVSNDELNTLNLRLKRAYKREKETNSLLLAERNAIVAFLAQTGILKSQTSTLSDATSTSENASSSTVFAIGDLQQDYLIREWGLYLRRLGNEEAAERALKVSAALSDETASTAQIESAKVATIEPSNFGNSSWDKEKETVMEKTRVLIEKFKVFQVEKRAVEDFLAAERITNETLRQQIQDLEQQASQQAKAFAAAVQSSAASAAAAASASHSITSESALQASLSEIEVLKREINELKEAKKTAVTNEAAALSRMVGEVASMRQEGRTVIESLHSELSTSRAHVATLERELYEAKSALSDATAQVAAAQARQAEAELKSTLAASHTGESISSATDMKQVLEQTEIERDSARAALESARTSADDARSEAESARYEVQHAKRRETDAKNEALSLHEELKTLRSKFDSMRDERDQAMRDYMKIVSEQSNKTAALEDERTTLDETLLNLSRIQEAAEARETTLSSQITLLSDTLTKERETLRITQKLLDETIAQHRLVFEEARVIRESEIADFTSKIEDISTKHSQLVDELKNSHKVQVEELIAKVAIEKESGDRRSVLALARAKEDAMTELQDEVEALRSQALRVKNRNDALESQVTSLQAELTLHISEITSLRALVDSQQQQLGDSKATFSKTSLSLQEKEKEVKELKEKVADMEETMRSIVAANANAGVEGSRLSSDLSDLQLQLAEVKEELLKSQESRNRVMEKAKAKLREQKQEHSNQLAEFEERANATEQALRDEIITANGSLTKMKAESEAAVAEVSAEATRAAEVASQRISELEAAADEMRAQARDAARSNARSLASVRKEADDALRVSGEREAELRALKSHAAQANAALTAERDSLTRRLRALQITLDEERAKISSAEVAAVAIAEAKLSERLAGLDEQRDADKSIIADIRKEADASLAKVREELRQAEAAAQEAKAETNRSNAIRSGLLERVKLMQAYQRESQGQIEAAKTMIAQLNAQIGLNHTTSGGGGSSSAASSGSNAGYAIASFLTPPLPSHSSTPPSSKEIGKRGLGVPGQSSPLGGKFNTLSASPRVV
jgi:chromosome segregation ATPase